MGYSRKTSLVQWENSTLNSHEFESVEKTAVGASKKLRLDVSDALSKPELIDTIVAIGADHDELSKCIELINERDTAKRQAAEADTPAGRKKREHELDREKLRQEERKQEIELKRLEL